MCHSALKPVTAPVGIGYDISAHTFLPFLKPFGFFSFRACIFYTFCTFYKQFPDISVSGFSNTKSVLWTSAWPFRRNKSKILYEIECSAEPVKVTYFCSYWNSRHSINSTETDKSVNFMFNSTVLRNFFKTTLYFLNPAFQTIQCQHVLFKWLLKIYIIKTDSVKPFTMLLCPVCSSVRIFLSHSQQKRKQNLLCCLKLFFKAQPHPAELFYRLLFFTCNGHGTVIFCEQCFRKHPCIYPVVLAPVTCRMFYWCRCHDYTGNSFFLKIPV